MNNQTLSHQGVVWNLFADITNEHENLIRPRHSLTSCGDDKQVLEGSAVLDGNGFGKILENDKLMT